MKNQQFKNTRTVADLLGIHVASLSRAVWAGEFEPPSRSPAGHYLWSNESIRRAAGYFYIPDEVVDAAMGVSDEEK